MGLARALLRRMFGHPTGVLGRLGGIIMARANRPAAARIVDLLAVQPGDRVLEIGFGPGVALGILADRASPGTVAGVDASREMVAQASARNAAAMRTGRVALRQGSVDNLPFASNSFDKVMAINAVQVWPDPAAGLREVRRVLRPGGRAALGFTPYAAQSNEAVTAALAAAGFANPRVVESPEAVCFVVGKS
jgi:ubiquinone/menaquinone biosynthesis C-methylase UbiE